MGEAQERFNDATNQVDRAYWQGALDGEAAERERVVWMLRAYRSDDGFTNADGDTVWVSAGDSNGIGRALDLIEGEN